MPVNEGSRTGLGVGIAQQGAHFLFRKVLQFFNHLQDVLVVILRYLLLGDGQCQVFDRWVFEEEAQRSINLRRPIDARQHPCCEQGMPAEIEEVVVYANAIQVQDIPPYIGDHLLGRSARCLEGAVTMGFRSCRVR